MAYAIENKIEHMCNGELSLHVLDIIQSIMRSAKLKKTEIYQLNVKYLQNLHKIELKKFLNKIFSTQ